MLTCQNFIYLLLVQKTFGFSINVGERSGGIKTAKKFFQDLDIQYFFKIDRK